jgi:RNA-directed DNA polymerase
VKRINNLFEEIISIDNLKLADLKARKGKLKSNGVIKHDINRDDNIIKLHESLKNKSFTTSKYNVFKIYERKERTIYSLNYYPDRIVHHAIINVIEPILIKTFTSNTFSCIKGRGIHGAANAVKHALKDIDNTKYCLKLDIKKFYPSIDHDVLKNILRRKIKDKDLLWLLDDIVDSAEGLPIGNYTSQYFSNLYLTYLDHWIKENQRVKYYFRYADDIVILSPDKKILHKLLNEIKNYLSTNLKLTVKNNYQIFPVKSRGIDFLGYVFYHTHTLLRKSIKKKFSKTMKLKSNKHSLASYSGWIKHCSGKHLLKKITHNLNFNN